MTGESTPTPLKAWQQARRATETAKQLLADARDHWQSCVDQERSAWLALQDWDRTRVLPVGEQSPKWIEFHEWLNQPKENKDEGRNTRSRKRRPGQHNGSQGEYAIALSVAMGEDVTNAQSRAKVLRQLSLLEDAVSNDERG